MKKKDSLNLLACVSLGILIHFHRTHFLSFPFLFVTISFCAKSLPRLQTPSNAVTYNHRTSLVLYTVSHVQHTRMQSFWSSFTIFPVRKAPYDPFVIISVISSVVFPAREDLTIF